MPSLRDFLSNLSLSAAGALVGAFVFSLLFRNGIYAPVLIYAATGFSGGLLVRKRFWQLGVVSAVIGSAANLYAEVTYRPFAADESVWYYITHIHELDTVYVGPIPILGWLLWVLGVGICFYLGMGRPGVCSQAD